MSWTFSRHIKLDFWIQIRPPCLAFFGGLLHPCEPRKKKQPLCQWLCNFQFVEPLNVPKRKKNKALIGKRNKKWPREGPMSTEKSETLGTQTETWCNRKTWQFPTGHVISKWHKNRHVLNSEWHHHTDLMWQCFVGITRTCTSMMCSSGVHNDVNTSSWFTSLIP